MQFSGVVEEVGANVSGFEVGQEVVGSNGFRLGAHAEYVLAGKEGALVAKPSSLSHEDAVSVLFGGSTAMGYFKEAGLKAGDNVLVNGASGAVGVAAVQIAKHMGATVTGVCSGKNVELVKSIGADHVIDYTKEDFTASTDKFDFVMTMWQCPICQSLASAQSGRQTLVVIFSSAIEMIKVATNKRAVMLTSDSEKEVMGDEMYAHLMSLADQGVLKPVIDTSFPFEKIADAHRLVDGGHKVGAVVVRVAA